MGYAISEDGITISERQIVPIYLPRKDFEDKQTTHTGSGCEDPRITVIDNKIYMLYTAYNGIQPPRVALTSLNLDSFLNRHWLWEEPVLISPPGIDDKDACIFPEKVKGKYIVFHRIDNDIVVDYVDSLEFKGDRWLRCMDYIPLRENYWEAEKVGIAAPPVKTPHGWFLLYHGVGKLDRHYRVGAMLLDLENPAKVLSRLNYPLLEPEFSFERNGIIPNVVFPCGIVVRDNTLYVYYGGADTVICVAIYAFDTLVSYLVDKRSPRYLK